MSHAKGLAPLAVWLHAWALFWLASRPAQQTNSLLHFSLHAGATMSPVEDEAAQILWSLAAAGPAGAGELQGRWPAG